MGREEDISSTFACVRYEDIVCAFFFFYFFSIQMEGRGCAAITKCSLNVLYLISLSVMHVRACICDLILPYCGY